MRAEDWQRVEELFHETVRLGAGERADYLARECGGDAVLRAEVESLVASLESEEGFIEQSALSLGMRVLSGAPPGAMAGRSVGHYRVERLLGSGGMGEVYLAEDSVLERPVALKFIANHLVGDEWAREQLMKEARAVARLDDANICAVHGVEESDGHSFIIMQYVEGETLASILSRGALGVERALDLAEQIAHALSVAHARGVIHRDVKPQNIIVSQDEHVKVLDFGLAKFVRQKQELAAGGERASGQHSRFGLVVGTIAYMSPEQAHGEELDARSDVFSFGIVLHEMLCGANPFLRPTEEEIISAVEREEAPPLVGLPPELRADLGRVIRKCLAKERAARYETADELLHDLRAVRSRGERGAATAARGRSAVGRLLLRRYAAVSLVLVAALLAVASFLYAKLSRVHTLAVLPIVNQSNDPEVDYLSKGLTRNLFDKFSYLPRLRVKLPSVAPPDAGEAQGLVRAGREMGADAVLSGQIVKQGDLLRLHLALLNTVNASTLWDANFNLDSANTFDLQDNVTREVAARIGLWLVGDERKLLTKRQTDSEEALRLYMEGQSYYLKRDRENIQKAIDLFERAKDKDPSFAQAYSALADSYVLSTNVLYGPLPPAEALERARWNARRGLATGPLLAETHASMGFFEMTYNSLWSDAEREFKRAIEIDPDYAPSHYWYSNLLALSGHADESVRQSEIARSLDPYSPPAAMNYGRALYYARRFDEAEAYFRGLIEKNPDNQQFLHMEGLVLLQQGRYDEAIAALEKLHSVDKLHAAASLGYAYGKAGRRDDALAMLRELDELSTPQKPVPPHEKALVYIGMGDRDAAFALLEQTYQQRLGLLLNYFTTDPIYDDLRPDPRFNDLARRLGLMP